LNSGPRDSKRREQGDAERPRRTHGAEPEQPPAREPAAALVDHLDELPLLGLVRQRRGVWLVQLLGHDETAAGHEERGSNGGEREPQRETEQLRPVRGGVERVDGDEGGGGERGQREQRQNPGLGPAVGLAGRNDAAVLLGTSSRGSPGARRLPRSRARR